MLITNIETHLSPAELENTIESIFNTGIHLNVLVFDRDANPNNLSKRLVALMKTIFKRDFNENASHLICESDDKASFYTMLNNPLSSKIHKKVDEGYISVFGCKVVLISDFEKFIQSLLAKNTSVVSSVQGKTSYCLMTDGFPDYNNVLLGIY